MKRLQDFINENLTINESSESKSISFNFKDLENAEETLKKFADLDNCLIEDNKLTVTVSKDNANKLSQVQDLLSQYSQGLRNSTKRASDEQYAQKTKSFEDKVNELNQTIDDFINVDADPRDDVKKEEKEAKKKEEDAKKKEEE